MDANNEKKEITSVVSNGNVTVKKKGVLGKMKDAFFAAEFKDAAGSVVKNVLVPAMQRTIVDMANNALNTLFFGTSTKSSGLNWWNGGATRFGYSAPQIDYTSFSNKPANQVSNVPTYDEIIIGDYEEANKVLDSMQAILDRYGKVTISDLYQLVGLPAISSYFNYGWKNLSGASIGVVTGGYLLKFPRAIPL